jgi:misacylated tRNA(Ala) deacylase
MDEPTLGGHTLGESWLGGHTADAAPTAWPSVLERWLAGVRRQVGGPMTATEELFRDDGYLRDCTATITQIDAAGIRLDRTVFYPMGGGQPGDSGVLTRADGRTVAIADTLKGEAPGEIVHVPAAPLDDLAPGETVTASIDWSRRHRHMRMHTCLHLLCAAVPAGVTGGSIGDGKGRLDFDLADSVLTLDKAAIEAQLNELIARDLAVSGRWIDDAELAAHPELVRTMSVKPPTGQGRVRLMEVADTDLQPCGGTHVRATGEIGAVRIDKIESKGKRNRRVSLSLVEQV